MADEARVELHPDAIAALAREEYIRHALAGHAGAIGSDAAAIAPKRTGAGAASIQGQTEMFEGAWTAEVSWDKRHYYMGFQDMGTRFLPAKRFLEIALDQHAHL